jgi:cytoplasmic iron level regulating protein YaaA (DUF328/UPF0246 family)
VHGGTGASWHRGTMQFPLDTQRQAVLDALGTEGLQLDAPVAAAPTMPAIERYSGVLYTALDHRSLDRTQRRRLDEQVVIFSALWGLVAPRDPIPYYKAKMALAAPEQGRLGTWWRPAVTEVLDVHVEGRVVWDLLPNEHAAVWPRSTAPKARITVRFLDDVDRGGDDADKGSRSLVTVSHWNKLLKGALVRHLLRTQLRDPRGLIEFTHPEGYIYRPELTVRTKASATECARIAVSLVARR